MACVVAAFVSGVLECAEVGWIGVELELYGVEVGM